MSELKIGWMGDSHIGNQQYGRRARRLDHAQAVYNAIQEMVNPSDGRDRVDVIIHTGDFLHSHRPAPEDVQVVRAIHELLVSESMVMYVISGNHDKSDPHWIQVINRPASEYGIMLLDHLTVTVNEHTISGLPYMGAEHLLNTFNYQPASDVLVLHAAVEEFFGMQSPNTVSIHDLPTDHHQLITIGDIHIQDIRQVGQCYVGYSGSTELGSRDEPFEKRWVLVHLQDHKVVKMLSVPIGNRPVMEFVLRNENELDVALSKLRSFQDPNLRKPIVFIDYHHSLPNVVSRFRQEFDPDDYILRFRPRFYESESKEPWQDGQVAGESAGPQLTPHDLLRSRMAEKPHLVEVGSALLNSEVDGEKVLDQYVQDRLESAQPKS